MPWPCSARSTYGIPIHFAIASWSRVFLGDSVVLAPLAPSTDGRCRRSCVLDGPLGARLGSPFLRHLRLSQTRSSLSAIGTSSGFLVLCADSSVSHDAPRTHAVVVGQSSSHRRHSHCNCHTDSRAMQVVVHTGNAFRIRHRVRHNMDCSGGQLTASKDALEGRFGVRASLVISVDKTWYLGGNVGAELH